MDVKEAQSKMYSGSWVPVKWSALATIVFLGGGFALGGIITNFPAFADQFWVLIFILGAVWLVVSAWLMYRSFKAEWKWGGSMKTFIDKVEKERARENQV